MCLLLIINFKLIEKFIKVPKKPKVSESHSRTVRMLSLNMASQG